MTTKSTFQSSNVEVSAYLAGRTGFTDEKLDTSDTEGVFTQQSTTLTEKDVSEIKGDVLHTVLPVTDNDYYDASKRRERRLCRITRRACISDRGF